MGSTMSYVDRLFKLSIVFAIVFFEIAVGLSILSLSLLLALTPKQEIKQ